ncbi:MAG: hypothetical protein DRO98_06920 [Archaeoglobales archaeon]|nr:MAG: hypothetical protein DRO98_06920 [Archaeoglobales archaeon]
MEVHEIKQAVREVLQEELPKILKEVILNLIPEDEPEKDEETLIEEVIRADDYVPLENVLKKYE